MPEVVEAYEIMRKVAGNIDQMKKNLEQKSRVKQLSGILDGWLGPGKPIKKHFCPMRRSIKCETVFRTNCSWRSSSRGHFD